jgi:hypothetical protein
MAAAQRLSWVFRGFFYGFLAALAWDSQGLDQAAANRLAWPRNVVTSASLVFQAVTSRTQVLVAPCQR